ncbi:HipA N-terminal domain-containing protein [Treponema zioleckii]|uniref:HipA N-terminal domain-containing protein n=1 Tax=Treponema zioleckii TaxID=331680 RepID=UPI0018D6BFF0|nr:HipA N-terminal domain-containing protein [Treponema zioleckii]
MKKFCLKVLIEINGRFVLAGQISGTSSRDAVFSYADSFLSAPNARAISLSFPLSHKEFDSESTKIFFDGLLPEGFTRQCVANNIHYPFIATALEILNTTENRYSGIPTIYVEMKKAGLFEPKFENIICEELHNSAY